MNELLIQIDGDRTCFNPGELIHGEVRWRFSRTVPRVELRLCWFTQGKGAPEAVSVETVVFADPVEEDRQRFQFKLPEFPFSFQGALIQLDWVLELIAFPSRELARQIIVIAPGAGRIVLMGAKAAPPPLPARQFKAA